jgi:ribonuclease Z
MNAKNLLLTHFSQRFPKVPKMQSEEGMEQMNIGLAFDLMRVDLHDFRKLPHYAPLYSALFND